MMRLLFGICTAAFLILGTVTGAQAQGFLLGMVIGSSMSGSAGQTDPGANVLYTAPAITERVKDPLDIRISVTNITSKPGFTLRDYFVKSFGDNANTANRFEVLQVVRVSDRGNADSLYLWFAYIEKEKIVASTAHTTLTRNK